MGSGDISMRSAICWWHERDSNQLKRKELLRGTLLCGNVALYNFMEVTEI